MTICSVARRAKPTFQVPHLEPIYIQILQCAEPLSGQRLENVKFNAVDAELCQ